VTALLDIEDLRVRFHRTEAVRGVSFAVAPGEALGIVGESGSGKSAALLAILGLLPAGSATVTAGRLRLLGEDVLTLPERRLAAMRGGAAGMVFQDPLQSLNPLMTVGRQVAEVLVRHRGLSWRSAAVEAGRRLEEVGIDQAATRMSGFPHELSGGMRQRVMIAAALAADPLLLLADEPTTALDTLVQAELVRLLGRLRRERQMGLVWVTHDLALAAATVDRVAVFLAGHLVETAPIDRLYARPRHPYTRALLDALPRLDGTMAAAPVDAGPPPLAGCPFVPRCGRRQQECGTVFPPPVAADDGEVWCWNPL
jgi:oligopeptide/dipeptide ABC transporter ATP-binding protein